MAQSKNARRVALITGGTRGIGFGISERLAADGFDLAVNGRREESEIAQTLDRLRAHGVRVLYCRADVADAPGRERMIAEIRDCYGRLNVLVNNAGVAPAERADILESGEASFDRLISINLKGPYFLTQLAANWMADQYKADSGFTGAIINVSSVSATVVSVNRGDYCISKAGIAMATRLWAARMAEFGVSVYEVRPGVIKTDMTAGVTEKYDRLIAEGLTVDPRWGTPEDVGNAVGVLARGELSYATGSIIMVDGGLTLPRL